MILFVGVTAACGGGDEDGEEEAGSHLSCGGEAFTASGAANNGWDRCPIRKLQPPPTSCSTAALRCVARRTLALKAAASMLSCLSIETRGGDVEGTCRGEDDDEKERSPGIWCGDGPR